MANVEGQLRGHGKFISSDPQAGCRVSVAQLSSLLQARVRH